jgi:hypothetical protein
MSQNPQNHGKAAESIDLSFLSLGTKSAAYATYINESYVQSRPNDRAFRGANVDSCVFALDSWVSMRCDSESG